MNREQFLALLWLRWRLWANRWRKSSGFGKALSIILLVVAMALVVGVFVGGVALGWFGGFQRRRTCGFRDTSRERRRRRM